MSKEPIASPKRLDAKTQRQRRAEKTKENIMKAAANLFLRRGFNNVTVDEITRKAGTSKGTFYCHFKSKYGIIFEQIREIDSAASKFYSQAMFCDDPPEQVLIFLGHITDYAMGLGVDFMKALYVSHIVDDSFNRPFLDESRPLIILLDSILQGGQKKGVFRRDMSSMAMVKMFVRLLRSWTYEWCMYDGKFNLTREAQKYFVAACDTIKIK